MKENSYSRFMRQKSDEDLKAIIKDSDGYVIEAREAAILELENRSKQTETSDYRELISEEKTRTEERKDSTVRKSRIVILPKDAPLMIKVIGVVLYAFCAISLFQLLFLIYSTQMQVMGLVIWLLIIGFYALWILVVNSLILGQNWARITYTVLTCLSLFLTIGGVAVVSRVGSPIIDPITILWRMIDVIIVILLFMEPCKQWFASQPNKSDSIELLDDLN